MLRNINRSLLNYSLLLFLMLVSNGYPAVTEDISKIAMGARPLGMGRAFLSIADDTNSIFTNPAGLSNIKDIEITSMYTSFFEGDLNYFLLGTAKPLKFGSIGFGVISTGTGQIISPSPTGATYFDYYDRLYIFSYAINKPLEIKDNKILWGVNLKYFQKGFAGSINAEGKGINADMALLINPKSDITYSVLLQNFLPTTIVYNTGANDEVVSYIKPSISKTFFGKSLVLDFDVDLPIKRNNLIPITFHLGAEYKINRNISLRVGLDQNVSASTQTNSFITAGLGLKIQKVSVDYAYRSAVESGLQATHFVSLTMKWYND